MAESQAHQVRQFVQNLEREDRYIVLLYYADGLSPMEIARVLDLPSTRVRTRLQALRTEISGVADRPKAPAGLDARPPLGGQPTAFA